MAGPNTLVATDGNFDAEVLKNSELSIVDFWAEWCGPCRQLGPKIDEIASEYQGKVKVYKMNVDENPDVPTRFHIRGIPTVIFFKNGQMIDQVVGNQPKEVFLDIISRQGA